MMSNWQPSHALFHFYSYTNKQMLNVPIGGKIPDLDHFLPTEEEAHLSQELTVSALHYTGDVNLHYDE